jgi:hypothetical protein
MNIKTGVKVAIIVKGMLTNINILSVLYVGKYGHFKKRGIIQPEY